MAWLCVLSTHEPALQRSLLVEAACNQSAQPADPVISTHLGEVCGELEVGGADGAEHGHAVLLHIGK